MSRSTKIIVAIIALGLCLPSLGSAAIVLFEYTAIGHGGTVTGTFGWDDSLTDISPDPSVGHYSGPTFTSGTISGGPQDGGIISEDAGFEWFVEKHPTGFDVLHTISPIRFRFEDDTGTALSSTALPSEFNLADWGSEATVTVGNLGLTNIPGIYGQRTYDIISVTLVPAPAAAWLFGSALSFLAWMRRKT